MDTFKTLLDDQAKRDQDVFPEHQAWESLPETAKNVFDITPAELQEFASNSPDFGEDMPDPEFVRKVGALMGRSDLQKMLVAIALNCFEEGGNNGPHSDRWRSYVIPLRLAVSYIHRSLRRP